MKDFASLNTSVAVAAQRLLGCIIEREIDGELVRVIKAAHSVPI